MASSGIILSAQCMDEWNKLVKFGKDIQAGLSTEGDTKAFIARVSDCKTEVIVDEVLENEDATFAGINKKLIENRKRSLFVFYCAELATEGTKKPVCHPIMLTWAPDEASIKEKMLVSTTKAAIKHKLQCDEVNWNDLDEIDINSVIDALKVNKDDMPTSVDGCKLHGKPGHLTFED